MLVAFVLLLKLLLLTLVDLPALALVCLLVD
jgi:hypothetical protein